VIPFAKSKVTDMAQNADNGTRMVRFGPFEADLQTQELRKNGRPIWLAGQSFVVLKLLVEKAPELVTREELQLVLWPDDTFVDFEHGLNAAVNKLRETLSDSAEEPKYIETLPRRGYRFIGEVKRLSKKGDEIGEDTSGSELAARAGIEKKPRLSAAVGIAVTACVLVGIVAYLRPRPANESKMPAAVPLTTLPGAEMTPALSPDGTRVAFAWDGAPQGQQKGLELYVKAVESEKVVRLTNHPSSWITPVWSPDGSQIAYHRLSGEGKGIYVVPAMGGPEKKLLATHLRNREAAQISWSADGKWIGFADSVSDTELTRVYLLNVETLEAAEIAHNPDCLSELIPTFSHREEKLAYLCMKNTNDFALYLFKGLRGVPKKFAEFRNSPSGLAWTSDDQRIVMAATTAMGASLFEIMVADGSIRELPHTEQAMYPTISRNNRLAYNYSLWQSNIWRKDLEKPAAPAVRLIWSTLGEGNPRYSPDGKRIAFDSWRGGPLEIWIGDADGENVVRIAKMEGIEVGEQWSPDGKKLAFQNNRDQSVSVYIADVEERVARRLQTDVQNAGMPNWSRDGKWIYFRAFEKVGQKLYRCPAEGGKAEVVVNSTEATSPQESFDGEELYYEAGSVIRKVFLKNGMRDEAVAGMPMVATADLWAVTRAGIYFAPYKNPSRLRYYDFATQSVREVFAPQKDFQGSFSLSPGGRFLVYAEMSEAINDLMLLENFR
jgi:Tol biopolymer transport system component/DNA-binding winged helix-turn-helix (wHTH) protein